MSNRADFEAKTGLKAIKANAIKLCGQKFVDDLKETGIPANHKSFWRYVNQKLEIPEGFALQKKQEEWKKRQEEKNRILMGKKINIFSKNRKGWTIAVFELAEAYQGLKFVAECTKEGELKQTTYFSQTKNAAYSQGCQLVDQYEAEMEKLRKKFEKYLLLKPIYLMFLYLSSWDEYLPKELSDDNQPKLLNIQSWIKLDFEILNLLEEEKLLRIPQAGIRSVTYVELSPKGIKEAIDTLNHINLLGKELFLNKKQHHLEWLKSKSNDDWFGDEDSGDDED